MMTVDLSIRPRRRWGVRRILLILVIMIAGIFLLWRQRMFPEAVTADWRETVQQGTAALLKNILPLEAQANLISDSLPQPASYEPIAVALVKSKVVENPESIAYTADLHLDDGASDPIPWANVDGRVTVETYEVQSGDTLWSISNQFGLEIDTLRWSNPELERNPDVLSVGTRLNILPVEGVYHFAGVGDTIENIAIRYGVSDLDIVEYPPNSLYPPYDLAAGQAVIVPFGRKDFVPLPKPDASLDFPMAWPVLSTVTGGFDEQHPAIDIGAPYGSTVHAADDGQVVYADWAVDGFGYTVIIDHGNSVQSWYSHLKGAHLQAGGYVIRGTPIGEVGSTGQSTGPHVHFEVRADGDPVNPREYLSATPR